MPDPYERHGRDGDAWAGSQPSRSQQRSAAVAERGKRVPGRKNPALCKAAHWKGPHQARLRVRQFGWRITRRCLWAVSWGSRDGEPLWRCAHEEFCSGCGKVLRASVPSAECPDFHPITDAERESVAAELAEAEARRERSGYRGPGKIAGRQGYRKPKSSNSE